MSGVEFNKCIRLEDFARLFGAGEGDFSPHCRRLIEEYDFSYRPVEGEEKELILSEVVEMIDSGQLSVSGKGRKSAWEKGWAESLERFTESDCDPASLVPAYVRPDRTIRYDKEYIKPKNPTFELNFYTVFRHYLFEKFLADYNPVYEFGCGTGYNLLIMGRLFPEKKLHGLDWAEASRELVGKIAKSQKLDLTGHCFDMFAPDESLDIPQGSAFITLNSLEQIGDNFETFLQYILRKRPALCINSEPLVDLYDENDLLDSLAARYHRKRGYLGGYLARIRELEAEGVLEIIKTQRIPFGSLFHEGYSTVIWKPK